jgi:hypothetical protein
MPTPFYGAAMAPRDLSIDDLNWDQLEQVSRLHFSASQRSELVKSLNAFVLARNTAELNPATPAVRQRLHDLGRTPSQTEPLSELTLRTTSLRNNSPFSVDLNRLVALAMRVELRKA